MLRVWQWATPFQPMGKSFFQWELAMFFGWNLSSDTTSFACETNLFHFCTKQAFSAHWRGLELPKERGSSGGVVNEIRNRHNDIVYIYTYTHIISILILKWCLLAFECIWLVFLLRFEEGSPKMHQTGWPGFMATNATTLFSLPIHFLICLPSYERWQKRWFSNLISKKYAGIHSLKLGKLPSPLIVWFTD